MSEMLPVLQTGLNGYDLRKPCDTKPIPSKPSGVSGMCYNFSKETAFLNDPQVKADLGVPQQRSWEMCNISTIVPFMVSGDQLVSYQGAVTELLMAGVHVLVYAGDADFMVDWLGCRAWVEQLPWEHQKEWAAAPRDTFMVRSHAKGILQTAFGLTFLQVFDAGHMVPMDQPEVSLAMVRTFLAQVSAQRSPPLPIHLSGLGFPTAVIGLPRSISAKAMTVGMLLFMAAAACGWVALWTQRWQRRDEKAGYLLLA